MKRTPTPLLTLPFYPPPPSLLILSLFLLPFCLNVFIPPSFSLSLSLSLSLFLFVVASLSVSVSLSISLSLFVDCHGSKSMNNGLCSRPDAGWLALNSPHEALAVLACCDKRAHTHTHRETHTDTETHTHTHTHTYMYKGYVQA